MAQIFTGTKAQAATLADNLAAWGIRSHVALNIGDALLASLGHNHTVEVADRDVRAASHISRPVTVLGGR